MRCWLLLVVAGCYQPSPPANAPCGPEGACPSGQRCIADVCRTGAPVEDAPVTVDDAPTDTPVLIDAMTDAAPNLSGCADGQREAFPSLGSHATIAGCGASWSDTADLRATPTGAACGDDLGLCAAPEDACAPGWHICGRSGQPTELSGRATESECAAAGGANDVFVAAMTHCTTFSIPCVYDVPLDCPTDGSCGEPVCCGAGCRTDQGCTEAVYPMTGIISDMAGGCGAVPAALVTGVLCCQ